jgi:all-trans-retinol 13,14-reductase
MNGMLASHYIGEMGKQNSFSRKLSDYITDAKLSWADIGEVYDRIVIGNDIYDFRKGVKNLINDLKDYFPDDKAAIEQYFELVFAATKANRNFYTEKAMPGFISRIVGSMMRKKMLSFSSKTTLEVLREITDNEQLIKVLTAPIWRLWLTTGAE